MHRRKTAQILTTYLSQTYNSRSLRYRQAHLFYFGVRRHKYAEVEFVDVNLVVDVGD